MSDSDSRRPDPQTVLAALGGFVGATVHRQLSDGPTNASYQVARGDEFYVLRIDKPDARRLGLDRGNEIRIGKAAAAAGLAPNCLHFDAEQGILLRPFLPGRSWTEADLRNPRNLARLAERLRRLHALEADAGRFDPVSAARRYAEQLGTPEAIGLLKELEQQAGELESPARLAPCHNDLLAQNILETGRGDNDIILIDWEYAALGDPWFDLAIVVQHHGLPDALVPVLLEAYLHRPPAPAEHQRLAQQRRFYQLLLDLWNLRVKA